MAARLISTREAAERLGVSRATVTRHLDVAATEQRQGKPAHMFKLTDVERLRAEWEQDPATRPRAGRPSAVQNGGGSFQQEAVVEDPLLGLIEDMQDRLRALRKAVKLHDRIVTDETVARVGAALSEGLGKLV